jgi:5-methylthioribose kinase
MMFFYFLGRSTNLIMIDKMKVFQAQFPGAHYFDEDNLEQLPDYLIEKRLIAPGDQVLSVEKPGEGNMNFVRRVITEKTSLIIKQSRPWVEKYPQLEAPVERLKVEYTYYELLSKHPYFSSFSPSIILYDPENLVLATQDLGKGTDFSYCYRKKTRPGANQIRSLLEYLSFLHQVDWQRQKVDFPSNKQLKKLNHEHIFLFPFLEENGFDLDTIQPGLQKLSFGPKINEKLKQRIAALGEKYLGFGPALIHGDYYPGSWLEIEKQVKVIDPEFAFFGFAEFDIGVMTAHLFMVGLNMKEIKEYLSIYARRPDFDDELFYGFCGTEILRRLIGLAQLPLELELREKEKLIKLAESFILSPDVCNLL